MWLRAGQPRPYEVIARGAKGADKCKRRNELRDYEQEVAAGGKTPPPTRLLPEARKVLINVRGAMNCATTNKKWLRAGKPRPYASTPVSCDFFKGGYGFKWFVVIPAVVADFA